ncbi:hypothetical protein AVEN_205200-1 [Araneus ventricosus]|uniref:Uncharacterized protein n=1 Tax=Araneus ventricosus TaxID=182803 RepID=A0A4Y2SAZ7_ARAVE|nr:hypothetical protein AVEN_205200-1 [Araneus ventricosus]
MVRAPASRAKGREFYPGLCLYSVFAIICNASFLQVRPMVTSRLALTCCKLVSHLHTCRDKFADLQCKSAANLLQTKIAIWVGASDQLTGPASQPLADWTSCSELSLVRKGPALGMYNPRFFQ